MVDVTSATVSYSQPTKADFAALGAFVAQLDETDWNPDVTPYATCRRGKRLVALGWLVMKRQAVRAYAGFMGGSYHAAEYVLTDAGKTAHSASV